MNKSMYVVSLGADPEQIQLGDKEGRKLRCAEKARGKKAITRWFNAIVVGYDNDTADRLRKGDTIILDGELVLEEYAPKKPKYKGEKVRTDSMPFAKIFQVVKSPTFFGQNEASEEGEPAADGTTDQITETEDPLTEMGL